MTDPATVLEEYAQHLRDLSLPLPIPGAQQAREEITAARTQLSDHVAPRLQSLDAPLLVVVGGSTGAGKSTLVNALAGRPVSRSGAIRPTTRRPVLMHNPADAPWFVGTRILPGLARVSADGTTATTAPSDAPASDAAATSLELHADPAIPPGLALLDAPDIDSVAVGNRELARQLLRAADLWLFVTTANRYADAVPWDVLRTAAERDVTVDVVMNRIPPRPGIAEELGADLRGMLERAGIEVERLFLVEEGEVDDDGMLPPAMITELREHLLGLAADEAGRGAIARRTLAGAISSLAGTARDLAAASAAQQEETQRLRDDADTAFAQARTQIDAALGDGSLLRGEVLSRWQDVVGTGEVFRGLESFVGRLRDRITRALAGKPAPSIAAEQALGIGLVHVVIDETARGAERADAAWRSSPTGRAFAEGHDLSRIPDGYGDEVAAAVRAWQGEVLELVRTEGADRRTKARLLSLGVNAVGVALMVVVFASTAFIPTGLEVGTGAATAVIGQKVLETIFGDDAVRRLARIARTRLTARLDALVAERAAPFHERLDELTGLGDSSVLEADAAALDQLAQQVRANGEPR